MTIFFPLHVAKIMPVLVHSKLRFGNFLSYLSNEMFVPSNALQKHYEIQLMLLDFFPHAELCDNCKLQKE